MNDKHKEKQINILNHDKADRKNGKTGDQNQELMDQIIHDKEKVIKKSFFDHITRRVSEGKLNPFNLVKLAREYKEYQEEKEDTIKKYVAYETVVQGATDTVEYYILLILSCLIATFGLYQNSPAVIIGAMIVAPLMGPILGFSAGMNWGSPKVIFEAVTTLMKGALLVLIITALLTFIIPFVSITPEMLARSQPTLFDIIIALACGFIGSYGFINNKVSSAIPGVAISVALMPPLCTIGIGCGLLNFKLAQGAGLLFLVNLICISLAGSIVFYLVKLHPQSLDKNKLTEVKIRTFTQAAISVSLLLLISIPFLFFMITSYRINNEKSKIHQVLEQTFEDDEIFSLTIDRKDNTFQIKIILFENKSGRTGPMTKIVLEKKLERVLKRPFLVEVYALARLDNQ